MPMSFQTAENQMKALKSLLIKLPTTIALVSILVFFIIAICFNPMIPTLIIIIAHVLHGVILQYKTEPNKATPFLAA